MSASYSSSHFDGFVRAITDHDRVDPVKYIQQLEDQNQVPVLSATVFLASFNTINKWALGISDTLAVGLLREYAGLKMPIVAIPCFKTGGGLDTNPAFLRSIRMLRRYGVRVIYEPERYPPKNQVPADVILEELHHLMQRSVDRL